VLLVIGLSYGTLEILWFPWVMALEVNQEPKWGFKLEML
jgi:hypothetical protein